MDRVREACEACFDAQKGDCSGFARTVAAQLGVNLHGLADQIVDTLRTSPDWHSLPDGTAAANSAQAGKLVMAGLKGSEQAIPNPNGHVVVVVTGALAGNAYPCAYWGSLGGQPGRDETLDWAWRAGDRDRVSYATHDI